MKRLFAISLFVGVTALLATTAPLTSAQTAYPVIVKHDAGETTLVRRPQRVIAIGDIHFEELLALGIQPVGYAHRFAQPPVLGANFVSLGDLDRYASKPPAYVGDLFTPSLEVMLSLKPDLIVSSQPELYASLSRIAPTLTLQSRDADSWRTTLPVLGTVFGQQRRAAEIVTGLEARLKLTREALRRITKLKPRLTLILGSGQNAFFASNNYLIGKIFTDLGFTLANPSNAKYGPTGLAPVSLETIPNLETDTVWVLTNAEIPSDSALRQTLGASQRGKVVYYNNKLRPLLGPLSLPRFLGEIQRLLTVDNSRL